MIFRDFQVAVELDVADGVLLAFGDVHSNVDVFFVGGNGHLRRGDIHVDIAAVQVVRTQTLEVTGKLFAGVLVVVPEKRQPVGSLELEKVGQVVFGKNRVTHDVDVLNGCDRAFVDLDFKTHAVTRLWLDLGIDRGRVTTLGNVLALQLVTHTFERSALEDFTLGQTRLLETFHQVISRNSLVALDVDARNRRPLDDIDDQDVTVAPQLDVLEESSLEQCTSGFHKTPIIRSLAHVQGQGTKHATGGNPLEAVDTDIGDSEGLSVNFGDHQYGQNRS